MAAGEQPTREWDIDPAKLRLHERVGSGRTAQVYRAVLDGREVAVKQFAVDASLMSPTEQRNLQREIAIMKDVTHPLLVNLIGVMSVRSLLCLVTEYCRGGCLFQLLHNSDHIDLTWSQQIKMACDVAQAMCFLHNSKPQIIHRDLKSLNLLLAEPVVSELTEPIVKVSDFGQSKMIEKVPGQVNTRAVGTQHWMAPEVLKGGEYDEKIDVYSYAMILYEIICREMPFEDESPKRVALMVATGARPDLAAVPPDCPSQLQKLMVDCWAQDPQKRPSFERVISVLGPVKALL